MPVLRVVDILRDGGGLGVLRPLRVEPGRRVVTRSQPVCPGFAGVPDPQPQRTSPLVTRRSPQNQLSPPPPLLVQVALHARLRSHAEIRRQKANVPEPLLSNGTVFDGAQTGDNCISKG